MGPRAATPFSGTEPLVGEIVGLRTFRVDESGMLLPLYSNHAWYDGTNTATCAPPTGEAERTDHPVAAPECECGFYAYGTVEAAARNRNMRYVQAVVSCWGSVVAGTQGVRSQHARIDALWLGRGVSTSLRNRIAHTYPSARIYADRAAMLAEHPLSELPCYESPPRRHAPSVVATAVGGAGLLTLGVLPPAVLTGPVHTLWLSAVGAVAGVVLWLLFGQHGTGHVAAAVVGMGVLAWLAAPAFGLAGWLLRVPLLRGLLVAGTGYLLALRPGYFPVVRTVRPKAFCGVRP